MAVAFEISSEIALFRKPYTTTSVLSYAFPPPTTIAGIISSILGLKNNSEKKGSNAYYWEKMKGSRVAIQICNPVSFFCQGLNQINFKKNMKVHTQINTEFIREPSYRIFLQGSLEEELARQLEIGSVYTPYLGTACAISNIKDLGAFPYAKSAEDEGIDTIISDNNIDEDTGIEIKKTGAYSIEKVPLQFSKERDLMKTIRVIYKLDGKKLFIKKGGKNKISRVGNYNVAWFPYW